MSGAPEDHPLDQPDGDPAEGSSRSALRLVRGAAVHIEDAARGAIRPALRGINHLVAFPISLAATIALVWIAHSPRQELAAAIYGTSVSLTFGVSAAFHNIRWPVRWQRWARRIDHSMIFIGMGGIYTALWIAQLHGRTVGDVLLVVAWVGVALGVLVKVLWIDAPRGWSTTAYHMLGLSWLAVVPQLVATAGIWPAAALVTAGALCLLGGVVYMLQRPNPIPGIFGFHEVFHLLVTLGVGLQFFTFARWLLPS